MAKSKTKSPGKLIWLLLVVAVLAAGYIVYGRISLAMNKQDFQNSSSTINQIYMDVVKQIGKPDNAEVKSFCSRTHQEFTKGDLSCEIDTNLAYSLSNRGDASTIMKSVQKEIGNNYRSFKPKYLSPSLKDYTVVNSAYHTATDDYTAYGLKCVVGYVYDTPRETDLQIHDATKKPFEITIGCYGPAKQQYYRLAS